MTTGYYRHLPVLFLDHFPITDAMRHFAALGALLHAYTFKEVEKRLAMKPLKDTWCQSHGIVRKSFIQVRSLFEAIVDPVKHRGD